MGCFRPDHDPHGHRTRMVGRVDGSWEEMHDLYENLEVDVTAGPGLRIGPGGRDMLVVKEDAA